MYRSWACLAALVVASSLLGLRTMRDPKLDFGDGLDYLAAAYHLHHDATFTQAGTDGPAPPALGREPGYAVVLSLLMALDPAVGAYRPSCRPPEPGCDPRRFRAVSLLNLGLIEIAGVMVFAAARRLTGSGRAAAAAGAYLLLDTTLMRAHWYDPMSDALALALVAAATLSLVHAWGRRRILRWALVGLALAAATLVKAAFLPFCLGAALAACAAILRRRASGRDAARALAAAGIVYAAIVGTWVARNAQVSGTARLTDDRGGIALSTREVFDHMTPAQYAAALVYWTPGFGEGLARRLFATETVARFDLYAPDGFYDAGQNGYGRRVEALMRSEGLDAASAAAAVDRRIVGEILSAPLAYVASTLPLLYRGCWIDQFGVAGLALLCAAMLIALRRRDGPLACIAGFGLYNELFYASISLNIPRYQTTALPAVALAAGVLAAELFGRIDARRRRDLRPPEPQDPSRETKRLEPA